MKVIGGSASKMLASELAKVMGADLVETVFKRFPDGEGYARIMEDITGEEVVLIQSTLRDENAVELFLWQDAIYELEADSLITVVPYFSYSRQDRVFEQGEAVSSRALVARIEPFSEGVIVVDIHNPRVLEYFEGDVKNVSAAPAFARYFEGKVDIILSPDKGGMDRAKQVSELLGCDFDYLEKRRLNAETVEMKAKSLSVDGRSVAIVDDIISTGGTVALATRQLKEQGASTVYAACTHGLFIGDALGKLYNCDDVVATDTVESESSKVSVAREIAEAVK